MSNWQPNSEERRYVECTASMSLDSLQHRGVADRATFVANLRAIADCLEELPRSVPDAANPDSERTPL